MQASSSFPISCLNCCLTAASSSFAFQLPSIQQNSRSMLQARAFLPRPFDFIQYNTYVIQYHRTCRCADESQPQVSAVDDEKTNNRSVASSNNVGPAVYAKLAEFLFIRRSWGTLVSHSCMSSAYSRSTSSFDRQMMLRAQRTQLRPRLVVSV